MQTQKRVFSVGAFQLRVGTSRTGRGVFAEEVIPKGSCIIEYTGRPATAAEQEANTGKYLFWTGTRTMINGNIKGNRARFINHSCVPNCEVDLKKKRIFVFALRDIQKGEELTYDYGPEYFDMHLKDRCLCQKCSPA